MTSQQRIEALTEDQRALLARRLQEKQGRHTQLVAYVVGENGEETPSSNSLRRSLSERLPAYMVPSRFVPVKTLPLLPNGKVDRAALLTRHATPAASTTVRKSAEDSDESRLLEIWRKALDVPELGPDDDFFEAGGDSILAVRVMSAAEESGFKVTLPEFFRAPTVAGMMEAVRAHRAPPTPAESSPAAQSLPAVSRSSKSVVAIRQNGSRLPYFLVHDLNGRIDYFYDVAWYLDPDQPLYAIQSPAQPFSEMAAMAAHYVGEIREHQPEGPYHLGGYCFGGCVAFEMARQLIQAGEEVGPLVFIDTVLPKYVLGETAPIRQMLTQRMQRLMERGPTELPVLIRNGILKVARRVSRIVSTSKAEIEDFIPIDWIPPSLVDVVACHFRALRDYTPRKYDGDVLLFRCKDDRFASDFGWGEMVRGNLEVTIIPGDHSDVIKEPHLRVTGPLLSAAFRAATMKQ